MSLSATCLVLGEVDNIDTHCVAVFRVSEVSMVPDRSLPELPLTPLLARDLSYVAFKLAYIIAFQKVETRAAGTSHGLNRSFGHLLANAEDPQSSSQDT